MDEKEKLRLEIIYSKMPDDELEKMLLCDRSEYKEGVYDLVSAEAKKRGFDENKFNEMKETKKSELPFKWGKAVIGITVVEGSFLLFIGLLWIFIRTNWWPLWIFLMIIGGLTISLGCGLIARKRWAFNILMFLFYINIPLNVLIFIFYIYKVGGGYNPFLLILAIGITVFNIIYFHKRKYMFPSGELGQTSASLDVSYNTVLNEKNNITGKINKVADLVTNDTNLEQKLIKEEPTKAENIQSYVTNSEAKGKSNEPSGYGQKLRELKKLKDEGLLTDNEYEQKRKAIVDGM